MIEAAHQRAVNEESVGYHEVFLHVIASEAKQSMAPRIKAGLLRFARNDERPRACLYAAKTSSLMTRNLTRSIRPKLVVSATSAASRPVPIRMRPIRGRLWRASNVYHRPDR